MIPNIREVVGLEKIPRRTTLIWSRRQLRDRCDVRIHYLGLQLISACEYLGQALTDKVEVTGYDNAYIP